MDDIDDIDVALDTLTPDELDDYFGVDTDYYMEELYPEIYAD